MPTRNYFNYAGWVQARITWSHESIAGVSGIIFIFDAFIAKEAVEMLEKVVLSARDVRWVGWLSVRSHWLL